MPRTIDLSVLASRQGRAPRRLRQQAEQYGPIVAAATGAGAAAGEVETAQPCPLQHGGRPCPGRVRVQLDGDRVRWRCGGCDGSGEITGWKGSRWDRRHHLALGDSPWTAADFAGPPPSWPRISDVVGAFAEPLVAAIRHRLGPGRLERTYGQVVAVWNAVVLADHQGDPGALEQLRLEMSADDGALRIFDELVERKRRRFPWDTRIVRKFQVLQASPGGAYSLWAQALVLPPPEPLDEPADAPAEGAASE